MATRDVALTTMQRSIPGAGRGIAPLPGDRSTESGPSPIAPRHLGDGVCAHGHSGDEDLVGTDMRDA